MATPSSEPTGNSNSAIQLTQCVSNGQVIYTDRLCPSGAKERVVTISVPGMASVAPSAKPPSSVERMQTSESSSNRQVAIAPDEDAIKRTECDALSRRVDELDAMARRNSQEWMRSERRKTRDRQYHLGC
jgi:hypothetical protein